MNGFDTVKEKMDNSFIQKLVLVGHSHGDDE